MSEALVRIKDLLPQGLFSDLTITCRYREWKVHKSILWIQSEYFRKLLSGQFMEANATTLDLSADDPFVLDTLIHYLYNFTLREQATGTSPYFVHVYAIADKYDVPRLRDLAQQRIRTFYEPYLSSVMSLEQQETLINAIRAVNECTPDLIENGSGLWAIILPVVRARIEELLKDESFKGLLQELPELNYGLLAMLKTSSNGNSWPAGEDQDDSEEYDERRGAAGYWGGHSRYGRGRALG